RAGAASSVALSGSVFFELLRGARR
ncbi:hypothetical protein A2U01_0092446, partial [Trifolium medium]|nr:hypothetical protein [Trifolium medium]